MQRLRVGTSVPCSRSIECAPAQRSNPLPMAYALSARDYIIGKNLRSTTSLLLPADKTDNKLL